jgi:signal transduction histidine kinase
MPMRINWHKLTTNLLTNLRTVQYHNMSFPLITKYVALFSLITGLLFPRSLHSQSNKDHSGTWDSLLSKLKSGVLNDTAYLKKIDSFVTSSPLIVGDKNLKTSLSHYKEIAFSNNKLHRYRVNYYDYLSDNAFINNLAGVCIYYAEKKEEELKKVKPYINSLSLLRRQYSIYARVRGGDKFSGTKSYNEHLPFLEWLPEGIKKDSVPVTTIRNAFLVMQAQANIFAFQEDSVDATKVRALAEKIFTAVKLKFSSDSNLIERITAYYYIINEFEMRARKNYAAAISYIIKAKEITSSGKQGWKIGFQNNVLIHLVDVYLTYKKTDSAAKYLNTLVTFENSATSGIGDNSLTSEFKGRLMALKDDYKTAYEARVRSSEIKDSVFAVRTVDINNNMYAQALAENTREELDKTQSQKRKLYISIACIVLLLIASVSILVSKIRKKEREMKQRIHDLNIVSEIQIAELEEQNRIAKQEEQKRLGMELHDDLAGSVAFVKTKIESEILNSADETLKTRLTALSKNVSELYEKTRSKSHSWYNQSNKETDLSFKIRVQTIFDNGLQGDRYKKEIAIDENALTAVPLKTKIELLYIIQEAITNILKHAKANSVSILIYQDIGGLMLQIIDDGIGFNPTRKKSGIGLSSIKDRVAALNGNLDILSMDNKGASINICIPSSTAV